MGTPTPLPPGSKQKQIAADPAKDQNTNSLKVHYTSGANLDDFVGPLNDAQQAKAAFEEAHISKMVGGKAIRAVAVIVGGTREGAGSSRGVRNIRGGRQIAAWSAEGGLQAPDGWEKQLAGYSAPE